MAQIDYGDYYKFAASAGIALIAGAVIMPWMFLREPFDLALEASKIALLTPDAQNIIHSRQHLVAVAINYLPWASGLMATAGTALTASGLLSWRFRQSIRDQSEDLQKAKLDKELRAMSSEEIKTKVRREQELEGNIGPETIALQASSFVTSALAVEQAILSKISSCLGSSIEMTSNQRLGNVEFDAIIRESGKPPIIVEIKYLLRDFDDNWAKEALNSLALKMELFSRSFSERTFGLLFAVIGNSKSPSPHKIKSTPGEVQSARRSTLANITISTIPETDIATIHCEYFRELIFQFSELVQPQRDDD